MSKFSEIATMLSPVLGGGLAGSLFTHFIGKRREKRIGKLKIALVPYLVRDTPIHSDMLCYAKLWMKPCPQPVKHLEIITKLSDCQQIRAWGSRLGINPAVIENNRVHFYNLKHDDIVYIVFVTPKSKLNFADSLESHLLDVNCEPGVEIQKDQSVWYE